MICDKCKQKYIEPSSNQHVDIELIFYTPDNKEVIALCPECKNKLYDWIFKKEKTE